MVALTWDQTGTRKYETGVDKGVLFIPDQYGVYNSGYAWNGLTTVTESPSGAEANPQYADNIKYLNLISAEEFSATIEAFTYPDQFAECDGSASPTPGVQIGQQNRKSFGLCYRTRVGNDVAGQDLGYKLHLIYGATAAPTEKAYATVNDSPEAITFSWEITTTPVEVVGYKPTSTMTIDSTLVNSTKLQNLEQILYGTAGVDPRLPLPAEVISLFGTTTLVPVVTAPTYVFATKIGTIPSTTGVVYMIDGQPVSAGAQPAITKNTIVTAVPAPGYRFPEVCDDDWLWNYS